MSKKVKLTKKEARHLFRSVNTLADEVTDLMQANKRITVALDNAAAALLHPGGGWERLTKSD